MNDIIDNSSSDDKPDAMHDQQEQIAKAMSSLPPEIAAALQTGDPEEYEKAFAQLSPDVQQKVQEQVAALAQQLGYDTHQSERGQVLASMPPAIQQAVSSGDTAALIEALKQLPDEQANVYIQRLQAVGIIGFKTPSHAQVTQMLDELPETVRDALESGDSIAFEAALSQLPEDEAARIVHQLQIAGIIGGSAAAGKDIADILYEFEPLLQDIAAVASGDNEPRAEIDVLLPQLEAQGWQLAEVVQRIWDGERNADVLTANIDDNSAMLVRRILEIIAAPPLEQLLEQLPAEVTEALQSGDPERFAAELEKLPEDTQQLVISQMQALARQLGYKKPKNGE